MAAHIESPTTTPNYTYSTSAAQSTRHIIDSTTSPSNKPTSSHHPAASNAVPFRPGGFTRTSSNYAAADALARQSQDAHQDTSTTHMDGAAEVKEGQAAHKTIGWKPRVGRTQSWNQQDMKHMMHMSGLKEGAGFTEKEV